MHAIRLSRPATIPLACFLLASLSLASSNASADGEQSGRTADRQSVDQQTAFCIEVVEQPSGRPVPLVSLRTTHNLSWVTDNAGLIAITESELMGREVYFHVEGLGYQLPADGFGYRGVRLTPEAGGKARIEVTRTMLAKRVGRLTGGGLFAHSQTLGDQGDWRESGVFGCDSVQVAAYRDRLFWLWGDTTLARYPLGIFHASGATTAIESRDRLKPPLQIRYDYFRDDQGRPRGIAKMPGKGPTWLSGLVSLPDRAGKPHLVATYVKVEPPLTVYERGLCVWDDDLERFEPLKVIWRASDGDVKAPPSPSGHAAFWTDQTGKRWALFGNPLPIIKCPASFEAWQDPTQWQLLKAQASLGTVDGSAEVEPHSGSIAWHPWRRRWVTVFMQRFGRPSAFGELWYAESTNPFGPWGPAVKVLSHDNYTFYNPRIHSEWFDADSPSLFFEGTYTRQFSSNQVATPRYDYNQILYRLDLDEEGFQEVAGTHDNAGTAIVSKNESAADHSDNPDSQESGAASTLDWVRVSEVGTHFVRGSNDERFIPWGVNYDHDGSGNLLEEYWDTQWAEVVEDFGEIKALGANCVRIHLQFGVFMEAPDRPRAAAIERLKQLVGLAERTGLYLDLTGLACYHKQHIPDWYDSLGESERWAAQAVFWQAVAEACHDSPAIFCYDLMNEPILPGKEGSDEWLTGELGGKFFVQRISLDLKGRTRQQVAKQWVAKMCHAIRQHDQKHLITVGVIPWVFVFGGGKPLFHSPEVGEPLDFVAVHYYPKQGEVDRALESLEAYDVGKPIVIEEMFPLKCGIDELERFVRDSSSTVDGWISFYWGVPAAELKSKQDKSIGEAITASWLDKFSELARQKHKFNESDKQDN